jgi:hypothetical protein
MRKLLSYIQVNAVFGTGLHKGTLFSSKTKAPSNSGIFNLYLLKGHILMEERFAGHIHVLQSKVCMLLQDMPTNISLHKHTKIVLLLYSFMVYVLFLFTFSPQEYF